MSFRPYAHVELLVSPKSDQKGFRGPRDNFEGRTPKFGQVLARMLWVVFDFNEIHRPEDFYFNEIHRPHPGPQENMQIGGVRCAISQIWPKFREMLGENPADIRL